MDRPIEKRRFDIKPYAKIGVPILVVICSVIFYNSLDVDAKILDKDKVRVGEVKRGEFVVEVVGSGTIRPREVEWVVPKSSGNVSEVFVKAGDWVNYGDRIIMLTNEEITSELAEKESRLAESKATLAAKTFDLESQKMNYEQEHLRAHFDYKSKKALYDAQSELMKEKNPPISRMLYVQTQIETEQLRKLYQVAKDRLNNFEKLEEAQINEYQTRVEVAERERDRFAKRVQDLSIQSRKDGIIQDFDLKTGQHVNVGDTLGKITNPSDIFVRLEVAGLESYKLRQNQLAYVEINRREIKAHVERIDPNVKGTIVEVDVALDEGVESAKIDMFVNARIIVERIEEALYVDKPSMAIENGRSKLYKLQNGGNVAELVAVDTGLFSSNQVQIIGGLNEGDRIILSELQGVENVKFLKIK